MTPVSVLPTWKNLKWKMDDGCNQQHKTNDKEYLFDFHAELAHCKNIQDEIWVLLEYYFCFLYFAGLSSTWKMYSSEVNQSDDKGGISLKRQILIIFSKQCHFQNKSHHFYFFCKGVSVNNPKNYKLLVQLKQYSVHCCGVVIVKD